MSIPDYKAYVTQCLDRLDHSLSWLQNDGELPKYVKLDSSNRLEPVSGFDHFINRLTNWFQSTFLGKTPQNPSCTLKEFVEAHVLQILKIGDPTLIEVPEISTKISDIATRIGITINDEKEQIQTFLDEGRDVRLPTPLLENIEKISTERSSIFFFKQMVAEANAKGQIPPPAKADPINSISIPEDASTAEELEKQPENPPEANLPYKYSTSPPPSPGSTHRAAPQILGQIAGKITGLDSFEQEIDKITKKIPEHPDLAIDSDSLIDDWCPVPREDRKEWKGPSTCEEMAYANWLGAILENDRMKKELREDPEKVKALAEKCLRWSSLDTQAAKEVYTDLLIESLSQGRNILQQMNDCWERNLVSKQVLDANKIQRSFVRRAMLSVILRGQTWEGELKKSKKTVIALINEIQKELTSKIPSSQQYFEAEVNVNKQFLFKRSKGDGDCFYHSVAGQITKDDVEVIKRKVGNLKINRREAVAGGRFKKKSPAYEGDGPTINQLLEGKEALTAMELRKVYSIYLNDPTYAIAASKMPGRTGWGTNQDAEVLAKLLDRPLVIESPLPLQRQGEELLENPDPAQRPPLLLIYNGSYHWDAFQRK